MSRYALLVATGQHDDNFFHQLRSPAQDVSGLARVLKDPAIGNFDEVTVLQDQTDADLRREVDEVLADRQRDDLVVVYFSCHGVTDRHGRLHFVARNTRPDRLPGTSVPSAFVSDCLEHSRAGGRLLLLDCCQSGAFGRGFMKATVARPLEREILENRGYVCITACDAFEYAFEGEHVTMEKPRQSVFTDAVIRGLESGAADLNNDGRVDAYELFKYVKARVSETEAEQTPTYFAAGVQGDLIVSFAPDQRPSPIVPDIGALNRRPGYVASSTPEEFEHWRVIRDSTDYRDYEDFLSAWPHSRYAPQCESAIAKLT